MMRIIFMFLACVGGLFAVYVFATSAGIVSGVTAFDNLLGSIFPVTISAIDLHKAYTTEKIKLLIVPGHDNEYEGSENHTIRESDLTLALAHSIDAHFKKDARFETIVARDANTGYYMTSLQKYFTEHRDDIIAFKNIAQKKMEVLKAHNFISSNVAIERKGALSEIAFRLYGINKWANENDIDIILHIHFNDHAGRVTRTGKYTGFSIYVPEHQYGNADASKDFARVLFDELKNTVGPSTMPLERGGIIEDQELIALGSNGSLKGVAALIEYGYIYEPQFIYSAVRSPMTQELAFQTYRAIKKYFEKGSSAYMTGQTSLLPYKWSGVFERGANGSAGVLALQAALKKEGLYPPQGKSLVDCPLSGSFGVCTELAVRSFQQRYADEVLAGAWPNGRVDGATTKKLNELFGPR